MNQTNQLPFEGVTSKKLRGRIDVDTNAGVRAFVERLKFAYQCDRHLIPVPAQIIIDQELIQIEDWMAEGWYQDAFTLALCVPKMLWLVREMMAMQKAPQPFPTGGLWPNSVCQN